MWRGLIDNQRQGRKLISGHIPTANTRLLSFNRTQSRVVTGLLIGPNTLRRSLHLMRLTHSPLYGRCAAEEETSFHVLCECEGLASLRHDIWAPFSWTQRMLVWSNLELSTRTELLWLGVRLWCTKDPSKSLSASGPQGLDPVTFLFYFMAGFRMFY
jgi:hypothetical protein